MTFRLKVIVFAILLLAGGTVMAQTARPANVDELIRKREQLAKVKRAEFERVRKTVEPLLKFDLAMLQAAIQIKVFEIYNGSKIVMIDQVEKTMKHLGSIEDEFTSDSIFNEFGTYGSEFSSDSIWNQFGTYGGEFSSHSPFNQFATEPPAIVKGGRIIGFLTVNKHKAGAVNPNWLKTYFKY